jgi:Rrf2 family protein
VQITAKADYAVRALLEIADKGGQPVKGERIAEAHDIPPKFLESILSEMRQAGLVLSRRGADGGYWLAKAPSGVTIADVIRAADGPLALVRGDRPESVTYEGPAERLTEVWVAVRASLRAVLEEVTLADVLANRLPGQVTALLNDPGADRRR